MSPTRFSFFCLLVILLGNRSPLFSQEPFFQEFFDTALNDREELNEEVCPDDCLVLAQTSRTRGYRKTYYYSWHDPAFARLPSGPYGKRYRPPSTMLGRMYEPLREETRLYKKGLPWFYNWDTALHFSVALAVAAPLANTAADENVHRWYQDKVRNRNSDRFASSCKTFGEGAQVIPAYLLIGLTYRYIKVDCGWEQKHFDLTGEWSSRCGRAIFAGFPTLLIGQVVLGAARPDEAGPRSSYWHPLSSSHGISGHAFLGAVPFITAAQMTDRIWLKTLFYAGSTLTGWSRINDDAHFLSQVILGWHLAYLSCRAISRSENPCFGRHWTFYPVVNEEMHGVGLLCRW
ncbi:MAG: phosphatase PAP2 family protein [Planctomycetaceae bacterium]|nr:phosphatase PAP2 family protein [Planctomycetaceae bacterium]